MALPLMPFRDTLADFISGGALREARTHAAASDVGVDVLREHASELRESLDTVLRDKRDGWRVLGAGDEFDVAADTLKSLRGQARAMFLKNPLIHRGVSVQADYVFGQGVQVRCDDADANLALQAFWDDAGNRSALTEPMSLVGREIAQQLDGETFFSFFPNNHTGRVRIRTIEPDQVLEVICNPDDINEPWYYKRVWSALTLDLETGKTVTKQQTAFYPDWRYNPALKPQTIGGAGVEWDTPVYHVKTGHLPGMTRGITEVLCQLDWTRAYTRFLENRATVASALSKIVLQAQNATKKVAGAIRGKLAGPTPGEAADHARTARDSGPGIASLPDGGKIEAISVKGATIDPDEGRRFLLMVAAGAGLPETFYGDASVGTLATAQSLDRPTELMMEGRRQFWTTVLTNIAIYVLLCAVRARLNKLQGTVDYSDTTPSITVGGKPVTVIVEFPPLLEHDVEHRVAAINDASTHLPLPRLIASLLLSALGVKDADEHLKNIPEHAEVAPKTPDVAPPAPPTGKAPTDAQNPAPGPQNAKPAASGGA